MALSVAYYMVGFREFTLLAVRDYFKNYLDLEPDQTQKLLTFVLLPWAVKIIYGLVADNIPICGSRRKAYLILSGTITFSTMMVLASDRVKDPISVTLILMLSTTGIAMFEVVIDALMVVQSRRDKEHGSEDLQSFSWGCLGIGGILGSLLAAFMTQNYHPKYCFFVSGLMGLV